MKIKLKNKSELIITEDEIKSKILSIIEENQIIELSDLLNQLKVSDKSLVVKVLRNLIDNNNISAKEEGDNIFFTLPP